MADVSPARLVGRRRRWLTIAAVILLLVVVVIVGYSCLRAPDRSTYSAPALRLAGAPQGVTYLANGMLYLVAQPNGSYLALGEEDPNDANRLKGCVVRWRPDLQGGIFLEDQRCGGAMFGRDGAALASGTGLLRHPVRLAGKSVVVDIRQCMAPEDPVIRPCKDFRR